MQASDSTLASSLVHVIVPAPVKQQQPGTAVSTSSARHATALYRIAYLLQCVSPRFTMRQDLWLCISYATTAMYCAAQITAHILYEVVDERVNMYRVVIAPRMAGTVRSSPRRGDVSG